MHYNHKRLMVISNRYPAGPDDIASPFVRDFHVALKNLDIEVDVITPHYASFGEGQEYINDDVHRFEFSDGRKFVSQMPRWALSTYISIMRYFVNGRISAENLMLRRGYDGILALWGLPSGYIARQLSRKSGVPYALWALGTDINIWAHYPITGRMIARVLDNADKLYADSFELADKTAALAKRPCLFIPSVHRLDLDGNNYSTREKSFVFVGRIEESRGVFDLLNAFREFSGEYPGWKLHCIGTGQSEQSLRLAMAAMGMEDIVEFHGYLERTRIDEIMLKAAAMVIPSHGDSLPLTFGEAMQANLPVVCSRVGDMPHFVDKYNVGYHYPAGNVSRLCDRLKKMAENHAQLQPHCRGFVEEINIATSAREISAWLDTVRDRRIKKEAADIVSEWGEWNRVILPKK